MTYKTRDISVHKLFQILQREFIVCELRAKIYPIKAHKEYWLAIGAAKKKKIIDIGSRNRIPSIFDDQRIYKSITDEIIPENGFPNFIYRDESQRDKQEKWDYFNYFLVEKEVRVIIDGEIHVGIISKADFAGDFSKNNIYVKVNKEIINFPSTAVTRIF